MKLPPRRRCVTFETPLKFKPPGAAEAQAFPFHVSVGFYPDGTKAEIFADAHRSLGNALEFVVDDAAVLISHMMQLGVPLARIESMIGATRPGEETASIIGALVAAAAGVDDLPPLEAVHRWINGREQKTPVLRHAVVAELEAHP